MLFVDGKALGIVEAKKEGSTSSASPNRASATLRRKTSFPRSGPTPCPLPTNPPASKPCSATSATPTRAHARCSPSTPPNTSTNRSSNQRRSALVSKTSPATTLITDPLRDCQVEAITKLEQSLASNKPRALIQMATGAGKTYTVVTLAYRLINTPGRVFILLVDRGNRHRRQMNSAPTKHQTTADSLTSSTTSNSSAPLASMTPAASPSPPSSASTPNSATTTSLMMRPTKYLSSKVGRKHHKEPSRQLQPAHPHRNLRCRRGR